MKDKTDQRSDRANPGTEEHQQENQQGQQQEKPRKLGWVQMVGSSLAAAFGVQSQKNKERDFSHGDPKHFVIMGIVLTVIFLLVMLGIVRLVLSL